VDSNHRQIYRRNIVPAKLAGVEGATSRCWANVVENYAVGERFKQGDEMRSSVEGLKLRRIRVRNEISCYRSTEAETERAEDLEALREELHRLSKQIEEAEHY
jgi:hypothetical protein